MKKEKFFITGMTCSACSARVEKCVAKLGGTKEVSVNLLTNSMQVEYDEQILSRESIIEAVTAAGYGAAAAGAASYKSGDINIDTAGNTAADNKAAGDREKLSAQRKKEIKNMKHRLVFSFVFLIPLMYIAMHHMLFHMFGIPVPQIVSRLFDGNENAVVYGFSQFLLTLPIMYLNRKYYENGFRNLFHGSPNMDTLVAVGSGAAALYGILAIFLMGYGLGHGNIELVERYVSNLYFESAGMIVTLITLGKYMETKSKGKTTAAIEKLMDLTPKQAVVIRGGKEMIIPAGQLVQGDELLIKPGESIAADGVILAGTTSVDESAITGESIPVEKQTGDTVVSATLNKTGFIHVKAEKVGEETTISQIIRLVDEASASKAPIARMADQIAGIFVPAVMLIALIAGLFWYVSGAGFEFALSIGISILVISCPCALGLATPVAIMVGTGKGAENGILIKSGEALETAHNIDTVVMDKTGTITEGKPKVTDIEPVGITKEELTALAAGLEKGSEHPLADAVMTYAAGQNIEPEFITEHQAVFGKGILGKTKDGITCYAGNMAMMEAYDIDFLSAKQRMETLADEGKTPLLFAKGKKIIGLIAAADMEKGSSREAIQLFEKMKISVVMLTGDNKRTAEAVRKRLGISKVIAQVLPEEKEQHIAKLQKEGHRVAMIGDGINDAPALARADVGIAIGAGTDVAIESADVVLMRNDLLDAVSTIRLSKAVIRNIKENLFWAFFYNVIGIPVAAGILYPAFGIRLSPMIGAAAMSMSSVCVVSNALRLKFFRPEHDKNEKEKEKQIMKTELKVEGMMCAHCKKHVEEALMAIPGVINAVADPEKNEAQVETDREIQMETFKKAIEGAGYTMIL